MEKRYQVFVSSTYEDLKEVRQRVILQLLGVHFIPVGMEFFPASDEGQWELIERVINECDYYVVIVRGRYGSTDANGMSYTEKEYRYARGRGIPTLAYIHTESDGLAEQTNESTEKQRRLAAFRKYCKEKVCKFWDDDRSLPAQVLSDILYQTKIKDAVGWVRADQVPDEATSREVLRLTQEIDKLKEKLKKFEGKPVVGSEKLSQGEDTHTIKCRVSYKVMVGMTPSYRSRDVFVRMTWNRLFAAIAPTMLVPVFKDDVLKTLKLYLRQKECDQLGHSRGEITDLFLDDYDVTTVITQFNLLGLVEESASEHNGPRKGSLWKLTPSGVRYMGEVRAVRKADSGEN